MVAFSSNPASYWKEVQKQMATAGAYSSGGIISNTANANSIVYTNPNTPTTSAGKGGYIPMNHIIETSVESTTGGWPRYTYVTSSPIVSGAEKKEERVATASDIGNIPSYPGDSLAESLFIINPKLRKKYGGDKRRLQADIMFAATERLQSKAASKLAKLLGGE